MAIFTFSKWRRSDILDYEKFKILTAYRVLRLKMRHFVAIGKTTVEM